MAPGKGKGKARAEPSASPRQQPTPPIFEPTAMRNVGIVQGMEEVAYRGYALACIKNCRSQVLYRTHEECEHNLQQLRTIQSNPWFAGLDPASRRLYTLVLLNHLQASRRFKIEAVQKNVPDLQHKCFERTMHMSRLRNAGMNAGHDEVRLAAGEVSRLDRTIREHLRALADVEEEIVLLCGSLPDDTLLFPYVE